MIINIIDLKLSAQKALLGMITENMRAITIGLKEVNLVLCVYFFNTPSKEEEELLGDITAEIIADCNEINHVEEDFVVDSNSNFKDLKVLDFWAYARR